MAYCGVNPVVSVDPYGTETARTCTLIYEVSITDNYLNFGDSWAGMTGYVDITWKTPDEDDGWNITSYTVNVVWGEKSPTLHRPYEYPTPDTGPYGLSYSSGGYNIHVDTTAESGVYVHSGPPWSEGCLVLGDGNNATKVENEIISTLQGDSDVDLTYEVYDRRSYEDAFDRPLPYDPSLDFTSKIDPNDPSSYIWGNEDGRAFYDFINMPWYYQGGLQ